MKIRVWRQKDANGKEYGSFIGRIKGEKKMFNTGVQNKTIAKDIILNKTVDRMKGKSPFPDEADPEKILEIFTQKYQKRNTPRHFSDDMGRIKNLIEYAGVYKISDFDNELLENYVTKITTTGTGREGSYHKSKKHKTKIKKVSKKTANAYLITFGKFFDCAIPKYLTINPAKQIGKFKKLPKNPPAWLDGTDKTLLEKVKELSGKVIRNDPSGKSIKGDAMIPADMYPLCAIGIYAGLRIGEIMHLPWEDFKWDRKIIQVINQAESKNNKEFKTKSRKYRLIPMADSLIEILKPYKKSKGYCIFPEKISRTSYPKKAFKSLCDKANITLPPFKSFGILRHTFGSKLAQNGVSIYKISIWMGHSSVDVTQNYYAHLCPDRHDDDINKLQI